MRSRGPLLVAALALVAAASLHAPSDLAPPVLDDTPPAAAPPIDAPASIEELKRRVADVLERDHVPGVAIALVDRDGPIWIGGVGVADVDTGAPMTADTVFRIGSLTKSFVVLGIMRLVEQGKLDLDAPLHLPGVAIDNAWADGSPITLAQLLEHTSGLTDMRPNEWFTEADDLSPADALAINPRSRVVHWRPGTRTVYSNVGFTIAARALELATGEPFDTYLEREVLRPLGIADAAFRRTPAMMARLATGYIEPGHAARFSPLAHRPAGAMLASANDLAKLVQLYLRRDASIVSPASLARIERNGTLPYPATDVSYGLANYGDVGFAVRGRGHGGGLPGYSTDLRYFPDIGRGYVILMNSTFDGSWKVQTEIRRNVFAYLMRDKRAPARGVAATAPASAELEPPGASYYAFAAPNQDLFAFVDRVTRGWDVLDRDGELSIAPLRGGPFADGRIVPAGDGAYRFVDECGSSIRFTTNPDDGTPVMLFHGAYTEAASGMVAHARLIALGAGLQILHLAPLWSALALALALRRRRRVATDLLVWTAIAGLACRALPVLFFGAAMRDAVGTVHPLTIALCADTILFAIAATGSVFCALRWMVRADRPPLLGRLVPTAAALAAFGIAVWFALHGIIGLRTWAY